MRSHYGWLGLLTCAGLALAQPPIPGKPAGQPLVLLLDNFQIVEGIFERSGEDYVRVRGKDRETFAAKRVLAAGESRDELQKFLRSRAENPPAAKPVLGQSEGFNSAALRAFPTRVQPVLMNLCASCHARADHAGNFKLHRVPDGFADPESAERNLKAVLGQVDRGNPPMSVLLTRAITNHGGQRQPSLANKSHPAYRNLELWACWTVLPEGSPMPTSVPVFAKPVEAKTVAESKAKPVETLRPDDPFDPAAFNRRK